MKSLVHGAERKQYVRHMFNRIAPRYDFLNHLLSIGLDVVWRKKAIARLKLPKDARVLDVACGTGDLALETAKRKSCRVIALDLARDMLKFGKQKAAKTANSDSLQFIQGDGEFLPFADATIDGVTIAFGIRNMGSIQDALREMYRILKGEGQVIILEFSMPRLRAFRLLYGFYFRRILPGVGRWISRDEQAYSYLPASVEDFPAVDEFCRWMAEAGFQKVEYWRLMNGVAVIYRGVK